MDHFQRELSEEGKLGALATFCFYLGLDIDLRLAFLLTAQSHHRHQPSSAGC